MPNDEEMADAFLALNDSRSDLYCSMACLGFTDRELLMQVAVPVAWASCVRCGKEFR